MDATDAVLAAGVRWLAAKRVTLGVIAVLFAVFALERTVLWVYGPRSWRWLFLAGAAPSPEDNREVGGCRESAHGRVGRPAVSAV